MSVKVLVSDPLSKRAVAILRDTPGLVVEERTGLSEAELLPLVGDIDAWVVRGATKVNRRLIEAAPKLRWVARAGAGIDNIDSAAANERGVGVLNVPGANAIAVAELVFGLLLSLFRQIPAADSALKRGEWDKSRFKGRELRGKTIGIVGLGKIGRAVVPRAIAFEMKCVGYDPLLSEDVTRAFGVESLSLSELYPRSEILTLHVPFSPETKGMIGAREIARLPRGAVLVNAARGGLVDEAAALAALEEGQLSGAVFDVFAQEPPGASALLARQNVVGTPHIGAATVEAQEAVGEEIVKLLLGKLRAGGTIV
ncbi:MAG TPA: hydroxyacid dehydrogenase [Candidatus Limnocylindrales bacterium]|nr:hydroxyacid dehydrogenase [Candidatus Limnocylindrales bacterium]